MMFPTVGYSQIPTLDMPGTLQAGNEVGQTLNSVKSSAESMNFLQKTSSAIGTFTKNASEFVSEMQEEKQKNLEILEAYFEGAKEHEALIKAQAKKTVDVAKDTANKTRETIDGAKDYYDQAQGGIDKVQAVVNNTDETGDIVEDRDDYIDNEYEKIVEQETPASTRQGFVSEGAEEAIADSNEVANNNLTAENTLTNEQDGITENNNDDSTVSTEMENTSNTQNESSAETVQPTRSSFETSFGYGCVRNSSTLAFAGGVKVKTGETVKGVVIVPKAISVLCGLDFE